MVVPECILKTSTNNLKILRSSLVVFVRDAPDVWMLMRFSLDLKYYSQLGSLTSALTRKGFFPHYSGDVLRSNASLDRAGSNNEREYTSVCPGMTLHDWL